MYIIGRAMRPISVRTIAQTREPVIRDRLACFLRVFLAIFYTIPSTDLVLYHSLGLLGIS